MDPILNASKYDIQDYVDNPTQLVQYLYVKNNPLIHIDPTGEIFALVTAAAGAAVGAVTGAYKSHKKIGKVSLKSVAKGAAIGAAVGAGVGLLAGVALAGSATASTAAVASKALAGASAATTAVKASVASLGSKTTTVVNQAKTVVGTAGNKIAQVAKTVNTKTTEIATKGMSAPGKAGIVASNVINKPEVAIGTGLSGIATVAGAKQTYDYIVAKEYKKAAVTIAFTIASGYFLVMGCKELGTTTIIPQTPVVGERNITEGTVSKAFKSQQLLDDHYIKHGSEIQKSLGESPYSSAQYLNDANHVIQNGTYIPELNGYVRFMGGQKYGFVGLDRATSDITTFHIKTVSELIKRAPSLGFEK